LHNLSKIKRIRQRPTAGRKGSQKKKAVPTSISESLQVVLYKKPKVNKLGGLNGETIGAFFTSLFNHENAERRTSCLELISLLVEKTLAMTIAVTLLEANGSHTIIGCVIFHPDNNVGSYIPFLGVVDEGQDETIKLNDLTFIIPAGFVASKWRGQDIAKFLLSMVQFTATMMYRRKVDNELPEYLN
jgi:hypothetical protein